MNKPGQSFWNCTGPVHATPDPPGSGICSGFMAMSESYRPLMKKPPQLLTGNSRYNFTPMRRPIRTLRLSIAAVLSLLAFVVVCAAEVNSFWDVHIWQAETGRTVELFGGRIGYQHP